MKKRKLTKFKRLLVRIASILLSVICLTSIFTVSVFAVTYNDDTNTTIISATDILNGNIFRLTENWTTSDNGTQLANGYLYSFLGDGGTTAYPLLGKVGYWNFVPKTNSSYVLNSTRQTVCALNLNESVSFSKGHYKLTMPIYGYWVDNNDVTHLFDGSLYAFHFTFRTLDNRWVGFWATELKIDAYRGEYVVSVEFDLSEDISVNRCDIGFVLYNSTARYSEDSIIAFGDMTFRKEVVYQMPSFDDYEELTDKTNTIKHAVGDINEVYKTLNLRISNFSQEAGFLLNGLSKFTIVFQELFPQGTAFDKVFFFSLAIGICMFIFGAVGRVGSFISNTVGSGIRGGQGSGGGHRPKGGRK